MLPFESGRIRLRRFRATDLAVLVELETDEEVMKSTGIGHALEIDEVAERLERLLTAEPSELGVFAAELIEDESFVAWLMLIETSFEAPELGFMLPRRLWGEGLATESAAAMACYAFEELQLARIYATTHPSNHASKRVLEKIGMRPRGRIGIEGSTPDSTNELDVFVLDKPGT